MRTLNLAKPETSDVKFEVSRFPDGQQDITISSLLRPIDDVNEYLGREDVEILSRFNNFKDLELILAATQALKRLSVRNIGLRIPYVLGARSDRQFKYGGTNYLVDIIAPIINSQGYTSVTVLDPHSDVMGACIKNLKILPNTSFVNWALADIYRTHSTKKVSDAAILVSPDAGSLKKVYKISEMLGGDIPVICCSKSRDADGKLTRTIVPIESEYIGRDYIIIDDICDGGRTFLNISDEITRKEAEYKGIPGKKFLLVTHGIFSGGFGKLNYAFDGVYTTTSVQEEWIPESISFSHAKNLKLLDVF